jgi:hypothetical protein
MPVGSGEGAGGVPWTCVDPEGGLAFATKTAAENAKYAVTKKRFDPDFMTGPSQKSHCGPGVVPFRITKMAGQRKRNAVHW